MKRPATSVNLVDTHSLFAIMEWARAQATPGAAEKPPTFSYGELAKTLAECRETSRLRTTDASLAFVSLDPANRSQQKFPDALERLGYVVERLDFRHNFIAPPIVTDADRQERAGVATLGPHLAYVIGLIAGQAGGSSGALKPEIVVVSGGFELFNPLVYFVRRTGGRALLCFFRRFLDPRWIANGLLDPDSQIQFHDLDPHTEALLGVNISRMTKAAGAGRGGFQDVI